jgi:hypothetical protein
MRHPNLEEYRASGTPQDIQAGDPFNAFSPGGYVRNARHSRWWERALAILSLAFVLVTLANIALRNLLS